MCIVELSMTAPIFSWSYYGWGNHTSEWVKAVDAVEKSRGFISPNFVDIRIQRTVRAKGFQGSAFEEAVFRLDSKKWF